MFIPSTITARRTRRYTSTLYIHRTTHKLDFEPMNGGRRSGLQPPNVSDYPPARSTFQRFGKQLSATKSRALADPRGLLRNPIRYWVGPTCLLKAVFTAGPGVG